MKRLIIVLQVRIIWDDLFKMKILGPPWWCWRICLETNKQSKKNYFENQCSEFLDDGEMGKRGNIPTGIVFVWVFHTCRRENHSVTPHLWELFYYKVE